MSGTSLSRRSFLKVAAVGAGLGGAVFYGVHTLNTQNFIVSSLDRLLGKLNISDEDLQLFCDHFTAEYGEMKLRAIIILDQSSMFDLVVKKRAIWIDKYERKLVTDFMMSTNYFQVSNPATEALQYYGANRPCYNPFARFDVG
ncbi:twin-arginine translocation signal domain-containing protein [Pseudomonadota bacterium]|uniref:twin-arginine translocation signal domain-containing protein n=1 Tax=unclassified Shewanella TaxID=196818 RepID=UPI000C816D9B|nr:MULTISPECIES: twin-arginine translocation signal domain-containing protein [unclassified Shewanella]MDO6618786.1 twin-arginine translocation signal domain-containing protein [Shewanella sp. 6_MG-2023]PMG31906.1 hypothetical protein BCU94_06960 [Shewanella sp. 10N.286.52.C2]PMH86260.1 hypothetical protein BCU57_11360 [Shewanella sp. 10N.286.48.B5]